MLTSRLFSPGSEPGESQSGVLEPNPRYTSPTTSSDAQNIYLKLTKVVAYCPKRPERRGSAYTRERLGGEE